MHVCGQLVVNYVDYHFLHHMTFHSYDTWVCNVLSLKNRVTHNTIVTEICTLYVVVIKLQFK